MKKKEREELEAVTTYTVRSRSDHPAMKGSYSITREVRRVPDATYWITLIWPDIPEPLVPKVIWCDCPGFSHQKFAHIEHKHIKLVLDYQKRGEPEYATYRIHGTGANTRIEFLSQSNTPPDNTAAEETT